MPVLITALFVASSMAREHSDRLVQFYLAMPFSRPRFVWAKAIGYLIVAGLIALVCMVPALLYSEHLAAVGWAVALFLELAIVVALTQLCMTTFSNVTPALAMVVASYALGRVISALELIAGSTLVRPQTWFETLVHWGVDGLVQVVPDLSRFANAAMLVYGELVWSDFGYAIAQAILFTLLLLAMATYDFCRKSL